MSKADNPSLRAVIEDKAQIDGSYAIAYAVLQLADAQAAATKLHKAHLAGTERDGQRVSLSGMPQLIDALHALARKAD